jgi:hypothetical protein
MRLLALSGKHGQGKFALVDDEDYERVSQYKWYYDIRVKKRKDGSIPEYCHFRIRGQIGEGSPVSLHRFVLSEFNPEVDIDHINENPLDNQKSNLRPMDHIEHAKKSAAKRKKNLAERKKKCDGLLVTSTSGIETSSNTVTDLGQP